MNTSESQFNDLLANLVARVNRALTQSPKVPVLALALTQHGAIDASVGIEDSDAGTKEVLGAMQESLQRRSANGELLASCISYLDYEEGAIVAYLENADSYCLKVTIPVSTEPSLALDVGSISTAEGTLYVFGESNGEA
jgi:hypothetical protein